MERRRVLRLGAMSLGGLLLLGIAAVLLQSLSPSDRAKVLSQYVTSIPVLEPGKVHVLDVYGRPVLLLRPTTMQLHDLDMLDAHVGDRRRDNWSPELDAFIYWGLSTRLGCKLSEMPKGASPEGMWRPRGAWLGGYWDPGCEVSYDYAGRAIAAHEYSYNGLVGPYANLNRPRKVHVYGNSLVITLP